MHSISQANSRSAHCSAGWNSEIVPLVNNTTRFPPTCGLRNHCGIRGECLTGIQSATSRRIHAVKTISLWHAHAKGSND